jgi:hypothetical protein
LRCNCGTPIPTLARLRRDCRQRWFVIGVRHHQALLTELVRSQGVIRLRNASNQSMKPTSPLQDRLSVFATSPCRGLSLSR